MYTLFKEKNYQIIPSNTPSIFIIKTILMLTHEIEIYMKEVCANFEKKEHILSATGLSIETSFKDQGSLTFTLDCKNANAVKVFKTICAKLTKPGSLNMRSRDSEEIRHALERFMKQGNIPLEADPQNPESCHARDSGNFSCR